MGERISLTSKAHSLIRRENKKTKELQHREKSIITNVHVGTEMVQRKGPRHFLKEVTSELSFKELVEICQVGNEGNPFERAPQISILT